MQNNNEHINLIFKHLSGDIIESDKNKLFIWIEENDEHKKIFEDYRKVWDISDTNVHPEIDKIDLDTEWKLFKDETGFDDIKIEKLKQSSRFSIARIAAAFAAVLLIGFAALYFLKPNEKVLYAGNEIIESKLPDGSEITINKNSSITYSEKFNKKERNIELEGDAYFKVVKDDNIPFIIDAESFYVEVLGTEFYVNSLYNERKVIVSAGTVAVYQFLDKRDLVTITAGEEIIFDTEHNDLRKVENFDENYLSWKTRKFNFNDQKLEDIFSDIEDVYDVKFKFLNPELMKCRQSVSFDDQPIEEILNVLRATFDQISFKRNKNTILVDGESCNSQ